MAGEVAHVPERFGESHPEDLPGLLTGGVEATGTDALQGSAAPFWDWDALDAEMRPKLIALGRIRFSMTESDSLDVYQSVVTELLQRGTIARVSPQALLTVAFMKKALQRFVVRYRDASRRVREIAPESVDPRDSINAGCDVSMALDRLDPRCRELLTRNRIHGYTEHEAGEAVGLSKKTVHKRITRCLEKIRVHIR